jgi:hypothetical protein
MKGAGQPRDLDFDPTEDAQSMSVFEEGAGKEWLETRMAEKLAHLECEPGRIGNDSTGFAG